MLGRDVVAALAAAGERVRGLGRDELDVTDPRAVRDAIPGADVVVNCAAWTAVDDAEDHEAQAFAVNALAAANVAGAARAVGARLVHVSTDYVFDGVARTPYAESDPLRPASAYGRTKAAGEWATRAECAEALVVRTAWLYGAHGGCFPKTIARAAGERDHLDVVQDQVGQPTWTADVADVIIGLVTVSAPPGTYHATASGRTSWFEFAQEVVAAAGRDRGMVRPTTSTAFVRPAPRPAFSVLGHDRLVAAGVDPIADWRERWQVAAPSVLDS